MINHYLQKLEKLLGADLAVAENCQDFLWSGGRLNILYIKSLNKKLLHKNIKKCAIVICNIITNDIFTRGENLNVLWKKAITNNFCFSTTIILIITYIKTKILSIKQLFNLFTMFSLKYIWRIKIISEELKNVLTQ